jgi:acyl-CoA thioester hydrolase
MSQHKSIFGLPIRVYFQDTDAGGVVYHASYVNFMERARTEWLRERYGYTNGGLLKEFGVVFVVRSIKVDYLKPAILDDLLTVTAGVRETGRSRVVVLQNVMRGKEALVEAEVHLVCVSMSNFKPVSIPEVLRDQWKV